ncbi:MAG: lasso peptide biosynthesis PqqD family chaperone [Fischerella sp.]|nr:lasso peptide biosynthesis PqqD family chaperone [Fischerella sp.]
MNSKTLECKILQDSIVVASAEQISSDLGGEAVILNIKSGTYHGLNEVGARIWDLIKKPRTVKDIKAALLEEYEVEAKQCEHDLIALLEDLFAAGLINVINETAV